MNKLNSKPDSGAALVEEQGGSLIANNTLQIWFDELEQKLNANLLGKAVILIPYTVATLPSASECAQGLIYVSDESGGAVPAFSDGTNWRRMTDRAIVS